MQQSLPPLHQVIPEFHSAQPSQHYREPPPSSTPRIAGAYLPTSPSYESGMNLTPSPTRREAIPQNGSMGYGRAPIDPRRVSVISTDSQYLPPVTSITSSRGSSFEVEYGNGYSHALPSLNDSTRNSSVSYHDGASWDDGRYSQYPSDYQSYDSAGMYHPPSPSGQYRPSYPPGSSSHLDMDEHRGGKRKRGNLPKQVTDILRAWFEEHEQHPYPTEEEKQMLLRKTGLAMSQISNWFINARRRRPPAVSSRRD